MDTNIESTTLNPPKEVQDMLYSEDMLTALQAIAKKHSLHIDQLSSLESTTSNVMRGRIETKDFSQKLMGRLEVDRIKADAIAQDVNDMLFVKIRDEMKQVAVVGAGESTPAVAMPPPPPPSAVAKKVELSPTVDAMLHRTTSSVGDGAASNGPGTYKTDPYREPVEE